MRVITALNPDHALTEGLWHLKTSGEKADSRNGPVLRSTEPVVTVWTNPAERVSLAPLRDANPFFHMYESFWMLAGSAGVHEVAAFAKQMSAFSDDNEILWGAYGWRWRKYFGFDQMAECIRMLKADPSTRRAVMSMWDPREDLTRRGPDGGAAKDLPCNTQIFFNAGRGALDMTVCNRSNDAVWGAYGANVVHMSVLHDFVAAATGLPLGTYYQVSNDFHVYADRPDVRRLIDASDDDPRHWVVHFPGGTSAPRPAARRLFLNKENPADVLLMADAIVKTPYSEASYAFDLHAAGTVGPMMLAHGLFKSGDIRTAIATAERCADPAWRQASVAWLERRADRKAAGQ